MKFNVLPISILLAVNSTFAIDLPFTETFEGGNSSFWIDNYPSSPAQTELKACSTGRSGQCFYLTNLTTKFTDYRPMLVNQNINMKSGEVYTISLFSKSDQSNNFKITFKVKDQSGNWFFIGNTIQCIANTEWKQCSASFTAQIPSTNFLPEMNIELAQVSGSLWLDDISITQGSSSQTTTSSCQPATVSSNLSIHIPNAIYQPIFGNSQNLWVDLVPISTNDGKLGWGLKNYGLNQ